MKFIWWESSITDHQLFTLAELSRLPNVSLKARVITLENPDRKKQGWPKSNLALIFSEVIPRGRIIFIVKSLIAEKKSIHIFGGPFDSFWMSFAVFMSILLGNKTYILTEPYCPIPSHLFEDANAIVSWIRLKLRLFKYGILWTLLRNKVAGIFAISPVAINQLFRIGVKSKKIFSFAYYVPSSSPLSCDKLNKDLIKKNETKGLKIIFVGALTYRKGLDLAIEAIDDLTCRGLDISLDIYGPGEISGYLSSKTQSVKYKGIIPFGYSQNTIAEYDILLLPSRYDGWGVVVNEAILSGVPVICSDMVGSAQMIKKWQCGAVFNLKEKRALADTLFDVYQNKEEILGVWKNNIPELKTKISPFSGAKYFLSCVEGKSFHGNQLY